jgi:hypothetical protein
VRKIKLRNMKVVPKKDSHCKIKLPPKGCGFFPSNLCEKPMIQLDEVGTISCEGVVSGRILCDFRPLQGVTVNLTSSFAGLIFENPNPVTDSTGRFSTRVTIVPGTPITPGVIITATAQVGTVTISDHIVVRVDCIVCINPVLTLNPIPDFVGCKGTKLTGRLTCDGVPIGGAAVTFTIQSASNKVIVTPNPAITLADGTYKATLVLFPDVDEIITITARTMIGGKQVSSETRQVTVRCVKCRDLSITLSRLKRNKISCRAVISGTLSCDGIPLSNRTVSMTGSPILQFLPSNPVTDEDGIFTSVVIVSPGTPFQPASITASAMVDGNFDSVTVDVTAGCKPAKPVMTLEIPENAVTADGEEIAGHLTSNGFPLAGIPVKLKLSHGQVLVNEKSVVTGEDGRFTVFIQPQPGIKETISIKAVAAIGKKKHSIKEKVVVDS